MNSFRIETPKEILLVDDKLDIQEILADFLRNNNYRVDAAANGEQALEMIKEKHYDLVISDLMMPVMNGFELKLAIPPEKQSAFIFLTGGSQDEDFEERIEGLKSIGHIVLQKPFSKDQFLHAVHKLLPKAL